MTASGPEGHTGARAAGRPPSTSEPAATAGAGPAGDAIPEDPQELAEDIERTREQLGDTVEALTARLDAKAQARATARAARTARERPLPYAAAAAAAAVLLAGWLAWRRRRR